MSAKQEQRVTRERTERKTKYRQTSELEIPEELIQRLAKDGMKPRWIRVKISGEEDYKNIGRKMSEGWEFIHQDELPESFLYSVDIKDVGKSQNLILKGDLALAKHNLEYIEDRSRVLEGRARDKEDAIKREIARNAGNNKTPWVDEGSVRVGSARQVAFAD